MTVVKSWHLSSDFPQLVEQNPSALTSWAGKVHLFLLGPDHGIYGSKPAKNEKNLGVRQVTPSPPSQRTPASALILSPAQQQQPEPGMWAEQQSGG